MPRRLLWLAGVLLTLAAPWLYSHWVSRPSFFPFERDLRYPAWVVGTTLLLLLCMAGERAPLLAILGSGGLVAALVACATTTVQQMLFLHPGRLGRRLSDALLERVTHGWIDTDSSYPDGRA